ncbi:Rho-type gtpase-activating protein [Balamuthia mandrillaris]
MATETKQASPPKSLVLELVEGKDLPAMDRCGTSDPYCDIRYGKLKLQSKTIYKTLNPKWAEQFDLGPLIEEEEIDVQCWDRDKIGTNDFMGRFSIFLRDFIRPGEYTKTYPLESRKGKKDKGVKGEIVVKLHVKESGAASSAGEAALQQSGKSLPPRKASKSRRELVKKKKSDIAGTESKKRDRRTRKKTKGKGIRSKEDENYEDIDPTDKARVRRRLANFLNRRPNRGTLINAGILPAAGGKLFGERLSEVMSRQATYYPDLKIPFFIASLIEFLLNDKTTFTESGLFRISGLAGTIKKVREMAESGKPLDLPELINRDDAASLLKEYLRELPEPIFTFALEEEWVAAAKEPDETKSIPMYQNLLQQLPEHNLHLWHAYNNFLYKLSLQSEVNMMNPNNIGIVIGPNVMWEKSMHMPNMHMNQAVATLVEHYPDIWAIFPGIDEEETEDGGEGLEEDEEGKWLYIPPEVDSEDEEAESESEAELTGEVDQWSCAQVKKWLKENQFGEYAANFGANGIDGNALLSIDAESLQQRLNVESLGHRKKILFRVAELQQQQPAKEVVSQAS